MEWLIGAVSVGCWVLLLAPAVVAPLLDADALETVPGPTPLPLAARAEATAAVEDERAAA